MSVNQFTSSQEDIPLATSTPSLTDSIGQSDQTLGKTDVQPMTVETECADSTTNDDDLAKTIASKEEMQPDSTPRVRATPNRSRRTQKRKRVAKKMLEKSSRDEHTGKDEEKARSESPMDPKRREELMEEAAAEFFAKWGAVDDTYEGQGHLCD